MWDTANIYQLCGQMLQIVIILLVSGVTDLFVFIRASVFIILDTLHVYLSQFSLVAECSIAEINY